LFIVAVFVVAFVIAPVVT